MNLSNLIEPRLFAKISFEGYCCMHGYLRLCRARGESVPGMAAFIGMHRYTIYYHYRRLAAGKTKCQKISFCMLPVIEVIEAEPKLLQEETECLVVPKK